MPLTGCPTSNLASGSNTLNLKETLPDVTKTWKSDSQFWTATRDGAAFDFAPFAILCTDDPRIDEFRTQGAVTQNSAAIRVELNAALTMRLCYWPVLNPEHVRYTNFASSAGTLHVQSPSGLDSDTDYKVVAQTSADGGSTFTTITCPLDFTTAAATNTGGGGGGGGGTGGGNPTGAALTFAQIEAAAESNSIFPTDEHYIAEYLFQTPHVPYWQVQNNGGVSSVAALSAPTPPANAIQLPAPSGGDDTAALESVINGNPGGNFIGSGGVYRLNDLDINVPANIWDVPSEPVSSTTNDIWSINSADVRIYNSPIDGKGSTGFRYGWNVISGSHRFHLINSGLDNVRVTDGGNMSAVFIRGVDDFHIACNNFTNIVNASGTGQTARANAFLHADSGSSKNGYIVNNTANNIQSNGTLKDGEFYTKQNFPEANFNQPTRIFANRTVNGGKRFIKGQSGSILALSNLTSWDIKSGSNGIGNRTLLAFYDILQDGGGTASNITMNNNRLVSGSGNLGQLDRLVAIGGNLGGVMSEVHFDYNCITINSNDNGSVNQNPSIFYFTHTGGLGYNGYTNSSIKGNIVKGSGGIEHHWDFTTQGLPSTGWPTGNLDLSGNVISVPWTVAEFE